MGWRWTGGAGAVLLAAAGVALELGLDAGAAIVAAVLAAVCLGAALVLLAIGR